MQVKQCNKCGKIQPLECYSMDYHAADNHRPWCKRCEARARWERKYPDGVPKKECSNCGQMLPLYEFSRNAKNKDRLNDICRDCINEVRF